MTDDQLHEELERRSKSTSLGRDWARHDLLPVVTSGIDSHPQRVATSRGPALAVLAGVVAIALVLVVALPRVVPDPASSAVQGSVLGGAETIPVAPPDPAVLSIKEFATRAADGSLNGATVLVSGRISMPPHDWMLYGHECPLEGELPPSPPPTFTCVLGTLEGLDRNVWIDADYLARPRAADAEYASEEGWSWRAAQPPVEGTLVLSISELGSIRYLGSVSRPDTQPLAPGEAAAVDIESLNADDVMLVEGWLVSPEGPGRTVTTDCFIPEFSPAPGLPNEYCQPSDSIASERFGIGRANELVTHIFVQRDAKETFGPTDDSEASVYSVAPRLHALCVSEAPCWEWEVVGRLEGSVDIAPTPNPTSVATPTPVSASPTPPFGATIDCVPPPTPPGMTPSPANQPVVIDETGLVATCAQTDVSLGVPDQITISNPFLDNEVAVMWTPEVCSKFTVRRAPGGFELAATSAGSECRTGTGGPITIRFTQTVLAESMLLTLDRVPLTAIPPSPTADPPQLEGYMECAPEGSGASWASIVDHDDVVAACEVVSGLTRMDVPVSVANPDGDTTILDVAYTFSTCGTRPATFELWGPQPIGDATDEYQTDYDLWLDESGHASHLCPGLINPGIRLHLSAPISAAQVHAFASLNGQAKDSILADVGEFRFELDAGGGDEYMVDEPIPVQASLEYVGDQPSVSIIGAIEYIDFSIEQFGGWFGTEPLSMLMCGHTILDRDVPDVVPFIKSGGYGGSGPHADFYREYFADSDLRLPAGTYRISAGYFFHTTASCHDEGGYGIGSSIVIQVR